MMIYLDTHVVVWLYAGEKGRFPVKAIKYIEENELVISPVVLLELQYLKEIGRLLVEPGVIFENLASTIMLNTCDLPFGKIISESLSQTWTRDPFDRIITAQALCRDAVLLTKDSTILQNYPRARWD